MVKKLIYKYNKNNFYVLNSSRNHVTIKVGNGSADKSNKN